MRGSRDRVTPELRELVLHRDQRQMILAHTRFLAPICVAPIIDPEAWRDCHGRTELDHIKSEQRMGVRAQSDLQHLVSLCEGHTEKGAKAGYQWNTAHRPELREYLARVEMFCSRCGVGLRTATCWFCGLVVSGTAVNPAVPDTSG